LRMVPFTIFHRLSSLGSGGGMNAATIPPEHRLWIQGDFTCPAPLFV